MSGIVGIFDRNGAPADRPLLHALTHFLGFCGPDGRQMWSHGSVGFGHTLLRATRESAGELQPASLDGKIGITADARIDGRSELERKLVLAGQKIQERATDAELILHAYAAWHEDCVQHLRGDFAFAIWDGYRNRLFCARDHFGIKPFYYADISGQFLFSNVLNCLRLHPDVSDQLNDAAIADFLLFGLNCDVATTSFRDIHRLPPAHTLLVTAEGTKITRYWTAPADGRIRYRHSHEYVDHFQEVFQAAVADRLRTNSVGILLSGGLDSGSVAAMARELSSRPNGATDLRAYTVTYDTPGADSDGLYARKSAEFLRIPIRCLPMDHLEPFERRGGHEPGPPEPTEDPFAAGLHDQYQAVAAETRVALSGEGADNLMDFQMRPYLRDLFKNRQWRRISADVPGYLRTRPSLLRAAHSRIRRFVAPAPVFPQWISPDLVERFDLGARWKEWSRLPGPMVHPLLPKAHASLALPQWAHMFEHASPGITRCAVETRYPFLDLRVVDFLLALPPYPWFSEKLLLREAMIGRLPEDVRVRRKTPIRVDPLAAKLRETGPSAINSGGWNDEMDRYVRRSALPEYAGETNTNLASAKIRPACLNFWLQTSRELRYKLELEARNA